MIDMILIKENQQLADILVYGLLLIYLPLYCNKFGYFLEIRVLHLDLCPNSELRKNIDGVSTIAV